jgi:hypothetical protein
MAKRKTSKKTDAETETKKGPRAKTVEELELEIKMRRDLLALDPGAYLEFPAEEVVNVGQFRAKLKRVSNAEGVWFLPVGPRATADAPTAQRVYRLDIEYPKAFLDGEDE